MAAAEDLPLHRAFSWTAKGTLAVVDQALFAGANFLVNVLLARWLSLQQYGAFSIAYSIFLLLGTIHTAVLTEPMMVFGAGRYAGQFRKYLAILIYGHAWLTLPAGLLLAAVAFAFKAPELHRSMLALSIAGPSILLLWLVRRACYPPMRPEWAATAGAVYMTLFLLALYLLSWSGRLSGAAALLVMGGSALAASLVCLRLLRPRWVIVGNPTPSMIFAEHWGYARWSLGTVALAWIPGNIYLFVLPASDGIEGVARLRAVLNLVLPAMHAFAAGSLILIPALAGARRQGGVQFRTMVRLSFAVFVTGAVTYLIVLVAAGEGALIYLYGDRYRDLAPLTFLAGLLPVAVGITAVMGGVLRAVERPHDVFLSYVASSVIAVMAGILLIERLGVRGALLGMVLSAVIGTAVITYFGISNSLDAEIDQSNGPRRVA